MPRPALLYLALAPLVLGASMLVPAASRAQGYAAPPPPPQPAEPAYAPAPPMPNTVTPLNPIPTQVFEGLSDAPSTHIGFTLDRSLVRDVLIQNGLDAQRAAAAVSSVTVDNYRFPREAFYVPEAMTQLSATYRFSGWKHLVDQQNKTAPADGKPRTALTDVWLHFNGADIDGVTVLRRGGRQMDVVQLTGDLRPLDLLHLSGHFGIPKLDQDAIQPRMVPAP